MKRRELFQKITPGRFRLKLKNVLGVTNYQKLKSIFGIHDFEEVDLVFELFKKFTIEKKIMFDVGAHHGGSLLNFATNGWKVFAFEPDNENRRILIRACKKFPLVSIDARAVSDKTTKLAQFYRSDVSSGISGLSVFDPSHKPSQTVETITLKSFIKNRGISCIDFLKIDTEGYDLMVLKGFPWENFEPKVILCEFEDKKTEALGYTFHDISDYLADRGYYLLISEWYPVNRYGVRPRWRRFSVYPCDLVNNMAAGNIIAIKDVVLFHELTIIGNLFQNKFK